jgi:hypothetical protein
MARLPNPGGDDGNWGEVLNTYLSQSHKSNGTLKDGVVSSSALASDSVTASKLASDAVTSSSVQDGSIGESQLSSAVQTKLNAIDMSNFVAGVGPYTGTVPNRPSSGAFVIWNGTTDPGVKAQDGDFWIAP